MALFKPGQSGNPRGRPKGLIEKRKRVTDALLKDAEEIAKVLSGLGVAGDVQAAALVLARAVPVLKPIDAPITFKLDKNLSLSKQAESVIYAISQGEMNVDQGMRIIDSLLKLVDIRALDEMEARLAALEARES
jgi:hypothetical protein